MMSGGARISTAVGRHRHVVWMVVAAAILGLGLLLRWEGGPAAETGGTAAAPKGEAAGFPVGAGLDKGPWPASGHDMRRSAQSPLAGPIDGRGARLLYDARAPLYWDAALVGRDTSALVATSAGQLIFGTCGEATAVSLSGRVIWRRRLAETPVPEGVAGFTVGSGGVVFVATHECPPTASRRTHVYGVDAGGTVLWSALVGQMYVGPAIAANGRWFTISDSNLLRSFAPSSVAPFSQTDLAGDRHGAIAIDSRGNLYVGTNGGEFHQPSLWSVTADGTVRWAVESGTLTTPVITETDRVVVAGDGKLHSYDVDGKRQWSVDIGSLEGSTSPVAIGHSGVAYVLTDSGLVAVDPVGRQEWLLPIDGPVMSPGPILDKDENLYVGVGNHVRSFDSKGRQRWAVPMKEPGQMIIAADGILCVVSERRKVFLIGTPVGDR
jgi:hypothetical protein